MKTLNIQQTKAVNSTSNKIVCLAGAGAGKSLCLLSRIHRLVSEGVNPDNILALTFSRAGAVNMERSYLRYFPESPCPTFKTFHSFCYSLVVTDNQIKNALGYNYSEPPEVADENMEKQLKAQAKMQAGVKKLSDKKLALPFSQINKLSKIEQSEYRIYHKALERILKQRNLITYDKMCSAICQLFEENSYIIQLYKHQYKYIFVDEFQDTDRLQWEFVKSFENSDLFVAGDALQNLYAFRGTDNSIIKELSENPDWETIKLDLNYRSSVNICNFANSHSRHYADDSYRIEMVSGNRTGNPVTMLTGNFEGTGKVSPEYIEKCLSLIIQNNLEGNVAILARTNMESNNIQAYLDARNIKYSNVSRLRDAENILRSVINTNFMISWLSTYLNAKEYVNYMRLLLTSKNSEYESVIQLLQKNKQLNAVIRVIHHLRNVLQDKNESVQEKCSKAFQLLGIEGFDMSDAPEEDKLETLFKYLLNKLMLRPESKLYVGTIHSVKGLEFDTVFLFGVNGPLFKLDNEDNNNVYYVGITRAKDNLYIYKQL